MLKILTILLGLSSTNAIAANITDLNTEYKTVSVVASKVKGVKVFLTKEVLVTDCNAITINTSSVFSSGNKDGDKPINWSSTYFVEAFEMATEMFCPIDEPYKETIASEPLVLESYSNPNIDNEVRVNLVIPKGYSLLVEEY